MAAIRQPFERVAQSYALLIINGDIELDSVPAIPPILRPRVQEIVEQAGA